MEGGRGWQLLQARIQATVAQAQQRPELAAHAAALSTAVKQIDEATQSAWATQVPTEALANAVPYMQAFGHMVLAWIWLDVCRVLPAPTDKTTSPAQQGRWAAARFFFHYELPKIGAWLQVVETRDLTCANLPEEAF